MKIKRNILIQGLVLLIIFLSGVFVIPPVWSAEDDMIEDYNNVVVEYYLWRQINEIRKNPIQTMSNLGIDVEKIREELGERSWVLEQSLAPLAMNNKLYESAYNHNKDMESNKYFGYVSPIDNISIEDRIAQTGYEALQTGESIGALSFDSYLDNMEAVELILVNMIKDELFSVDPNYRIFSDNLTEIGISIELSLLTFVKNRESRAYVIVMDYGKPVSERTFVIGNVIRGSRNSNELFKTDDVIDRYFVKFKDVFLGNGTIQTAETSILGAYQFPKISSFYMILTAVMSLDDPYYVAENRFLGRNGNELQDIIVYE